MVGLKKGLPLSKRAYLLSGNTYEEVQDENEIRINPGSMP
jgi:hypothetical protein